MIARISAAALAAFLFVLPAEAQTIGNVLPGGCGSITYDGSPRALTMDANGKLCTSGTGGGGGGTSYTQNYGNPIGALGTPGGFKDASGNFQSFLGDTTFGQWVTIKGTLPNYATPPTFVLTAETTKVIGTTRNVGASGAVLDFSGQNAASPAGAWLMGGQFNTTPAPITSGNASPLQLDANGNLKVNVINGGGGGGGAVYGPTAKGTAAANPPVLQGGTIDGTATGAVGVAKVDANGTQFFDAPAGSALLNAVNSPIPAGTSAIGNVGTAPRASQLTKAVVNFAASGDNIVVTRAVGTIKVYRLSFICASAVTVTIKNGTSTAVTGAMAGVTSVYRPYEGGEPQFETTGTNNLVINLGSAVSCQGDIAYLDN